MRIFKWLKKLRYLVVLFAVNMLLSFLIEPVSGASSRVWSGYYDQEELDTIFVGSSLCQQTFIPDVFNENLGVKAYNLGTPSQAMTQTLRAVEVALEEHDIKTIVYGMGFSSLKYEPIPEAELTFESARAREKGGIKGLFATLSYICSEDVRAEEKSINFLFPWLYNYENYSREKITENVTKKVQRWKTLWETGSYDDTDGLSKGYRNDDKTVFNYDNKWVNNSFNSYEAYYSREMLDEFEALCVLCQEKDVELIILNTPHPSFDVVSCYEFYEQNKNQLLAICERYDAYYYDFSLAKPEIFEIKEDYFGDYEHLNRIGSQVFCQQLCEFFKLRNAGEDVEQYFYSIEEFLEIHAEELEEWKSFQANVQ